MTETINKTTWKDLLAAEKQLPYFKNMIETLKRENAAGKIIYPPQKDIFNAIKLTPFEDVKVVIIGQDPYHGPGQAHGLSFSVRPGIKPPPSLENMFKELESDIGFKRPDHGFLEPWAKQGVMLLNAVLTVQAHQAHSHAKIGWQTFTDKIIQCLNDERSDLIFLLWGASAQKKGQIIDKNKHHVLTAPHPSPLSAHRGFFGCKHFSTCNEILKRLGKTPINWQL